MQQQPQQHQQQHQQQQQQQQSTSTSASGNANVNVNTASSCTCNGLALQYEAMCSGMDDILHTDTDTDTAVSGTSSGGIGIGALLVFTPSELRSMACGRHWQLEDGDGDGDGGGDSGVWSRQTALSMLQPSGAYATNNRNGSSGSGSGSGSMGLHRVVRWLVEEMMGMSAKDRSRLLEFVTSSPSLPADGLHPPIEVHRW
jgi:hypothetical protein